ncbi:hypothetical protein BB8028_0004g05980 [Beauveria bassiana]|uniref:Uncharacterized protein n=1 Tax=Beauveria bassiana TaxID=176275 RepID=A0A2S7YC36_BEABA|nr:hypothetical protein BB8028_0004g05980 [Beauveria bassiana]
MYLSFAANAVGEGDVHVLCLRLTYELLTGKYKLPEATDARSNLARYEIGLSCELESYLEAAGSKVEHARLFNTAVLPRCRSYIVAIGQRMAWEVAKDSKYVSQ